MTPTDSVRLVRVWRRLQLLTAALLGLSAAIPVGAQIANGGFEAGDFRGWTADPNWEVADDARTYYAEWDGGYWAWSGALGEPAVGNLTSEPFTLEKDAVCMLLAGWSSIRGAGTPRTWNYVTLNLEDGREIARAYVPDSTTFMPVWLDGSGHRGETVYLQAVDDADHDTYSMMCVDAVHLGDLPSGYAAPIRPVPEFDPATSVRLEDHRYLVEVSRRNGSITRLQDKVSGLELIREPRLAGSFRFALPIPGDEPWQTIEANWIVGVEQDLDSCELDGTALSLTWGPPLRNYLGEDFEAAATMTVELGDEGVQFGLELDNRSGLPVGEVYFPVLGGIQGLGSTRGELRSTQMVRPVNSGEDSEAATIAHAAVRIFRVFANQSPFGDQGPEQCYQYPEALAEPWIGLKAPGAGRWALLQAPDPSGHELWVRLELVPSSAGATRDDGNWPRPEELRGQPVGVEACFVDVKGHPPGSTYQAMPALVRFSDGPPGTQ